MSGLSARLSGRIGDLDLEVAFTAPVRTVTALVGPSGSGKSTILRALAGLERLKGEVTVDGGVWQDARRRRPAHERAVGYVFQFGGLLPHLSVRGNLDYARKRAGADGNDVAHAISLLRLAPLLDRSPDRLSGGERARVALARALLVRPKLILLDEPLSGLDVEARDALLPELAETLRGLAAPVIYVSHDPSEVARLAQHVIRLRAGKIVV